MKYNTWGYKKYNTSVPGEGKRAKCICLKRVKMYQNAKKYTSDF